MKKITSVLLALSLLLALAAPAFAASPEEAKPEGILLSVTTETLPGGYTLVTETRLLSQTRGSNTYTRNAYAYHNGANVASLTLTASFTYNPGVSSSCTSASESHTVYADDWSCASASASKSGATASATGTFEKKFLFITLETKTINVSMYCDSYGNIS